MENCKTELEEFLIQSQQNNESKQILKKMRKKGSFLSMENLIEQADEEIAQKKKGDDQDNTETSIQVDQDSASKDLENVTVYPIFILSQSFAKVTAVGSSTAMVAIRNQKMLHLANLGDSGFVLIRFRNGEAYTAARSKEQQHSFNIPYQIAILPGPKEIEQLKAKGRIEEVKKLKQILKRSDSMCQDRPEDSDEYSYELLDGDIIVSATDGVFDNLFSHEILQIVRTFKQKQKRL